MGCLQVGLLLLGFGFGGRVFTRSLLLPSRLFSTGRLFINIVAFAGASIVGSVAFTRLERECDGSCAVRV